MNKQLPQIDNFNLIYIFVLAAMVMVIKIRWSMNAKTDVYAMCRMLTQLIIIGYLLSFIFTSQKAILITLILLFMNTLAAWIGLRTVKEQRLKLLPMAFYAIFFSGSVTLIIVTQAVLKVSPWYKPQFIIPLGGMIYSSSMTSVSLAAERFFSEFKKSKNMKNSRNIAFKAALIPISNSLFAVGLVSLPGMMTGQILSGIEPVVAARYQIVVMCMIYASTGLSAAIFLHFVSKKNKIDN